MGRFPRFGAARSRSPERSSGACPSSSTTAWWKEERGAKVFIDYNQNARDRTIASGYSVRARPDGTVSAPVTWEELPDVETEDFTIATMPDRFGQLGDVHEGIDDSLCDLRVLLEWVERDEQAGVGEAPYPPALSEDAGRAGPRSALTGAKRKRQARDTPRTGLNRPSNAAGYVFRLRSRGGRR